jgi:hypothetical protein
MLLEVLPAVGNYAVRYNNHGYFTFEIRKIIPAVIFTIENYHRAKATSLE